MSDRGGPTSDAILSSVAGLLRIPANDWGAVHIVTGWIKPSGDAIRLVYDQVGAHGRRIGYRHRLFDDGRRIPLAELAERIIDDIDDPLGPVWDILTEQDGVWWWGDGFPGLDTHPEYPFRPALRTRLRPAWTRRRRVVTLVDPEPRDSDPRPPRARSRSGWRWRRTRRRTPT